MLFLSSLLCQKDYYQILLYYDEIQHLGVGNEAVSDTNGKKSIWELNAKSI